jgi:hypothetical protein
VSFRSAALVFSLLLLLGSGCSWPGSGASTAGSGSSTAGTGAQKSMGGWPVERELTEAGAATAAPRAAPAPGRERAARALAAPAPQTTAAAPAVLPAAPQATAAKPAEKPLAVRR